MNWHWWSLVHTVFVQLRSFAGQQSAATSHSALTQTFPVTESAKFCGKQTPPAPFALHS
jgi:hypothetical protein